MNDGHAILYGTLTGIFLGMLWIFFLEVFNINILWWIIPAI